MPGSWSSSSHAKTTAGDDLEQRHERGQPRAEPPARRDAGRVGERRGDHAEADERQPPGDGFPGVGRRGGRRAHRQDADDAEHSQADRAHREAAARQGERWHAAARVGGHDEVRRGAEHRRERPQHAVQGQVGARQQVQDEHEPDGGDARARERQRAGDARRGAATATRRSAAGAVYSISSAGPTSIAATAEKNANCVPATGTAPYSRTMRALRRSRPQRAAQRPRRERGDDERGDGDPGEHDRAGAPAGIDQPAGQRARQPERRGRDEREEQPGPHRRPALAVICHRRHDQ